MSSVVGVKIIPHDFHQSVNANRLGVYAALWIEGVEVAVRGPHEAVLHPIGVMVVTRDGTPRIDGADVVSPRARWIDVGHGAARFSHAAACPAKNWDR